MSTNVQINAEDGALVVTLGDTKVEISADGRDVTTYTKDGVEIKPASKTAGCKDSQLTISEDGKTVTAKGVTIAQEADGHISIAANGAAVTNQSLTKAEPEAPQRELQPGDKMQDGTVYAGVSPDTGTAMFVPEVDERICESWKDAQKLAKTARFNHGHEDWRVPSPAEQVVLFANRNKGALKNTFNDWSANWGGLYWSSDSGRYYAKAFNFAKGEAQSVYKGYGSASVRLVRTP